METRWAILSTKTLRGRLGLAYASALIVALVVFAVLALVVVDRAQRTALDEQLQSTAAALRIIGDIKDHRLVVDAGDRKQFDAVVGTKADSAILSSDGTVAVSTDDATARSIAALVPAQDGSALSYVSVDGTRLRVLATAIMSDGVKVGETLTWRDSSVIWALDRRVAIAFALVIPIIAGLAALAAGEIARRGLAPLDRIATLASEIEAQDLSRRLSLPVRDDELGRLGATFDRMLDRLQSAFDRERRFTSDASHELRAPLSVIRAEADLALRSEREPAEYRRALETIATESDALEALTRDLLTAARNGSDVEDARGPVDLSLVASTVAQRMSVLAADRHVKVNGVSSGAVIVRGNRTLIERAVVSVLHNALKYSPEAGSVEVSVRAQSPDAELTIRDEGPGFSQTALSRAFDRFWRDDAARARDGSGLGLSLAKTIVERYGGTIVLANAEPHGAIVRMRFPVK